MEKSPSASHTEILTPPQGGPLRYPERLMEAYPVSRKVGNPANDYAELIEPIA